MAIATKAKTECVHALTLIVSWLVFFWTLPELLVYHVENIVVLVLPLNSAFQSFSMSL